MPIKWDLKKKLHYLCSQSVDPGYMLVQMPTTIPAMLVLRSCAYRLAICSLSTTVPAMLVLRRCTYRLAICSRIYVILRQITNPSNGLDSTLTDSVHTSPSHVRTLANRLAVQNTINSRPFYIHEFTLRVLDVLELKQGQSMAGNNIQDG